MEDKLSATLSKYGQFGLVREGELLLAPEAAKLLLDDLEQLRVGILGVDVWYPQDDDFFEDLGGLNLSHLVGRQQWIDTSISTTRRFITSGLPPNAVFVSFVTGEEFSK